MSLILLGLSPTVFHLSEVSWVWNMPQLRATDIQLTYFHMRQEIIIISYTSYFWADLICIQIWCYFVAIIIISRSAYYIWWKSHANHRHLLLRTFNSSSLEDFQPINMYHLSTRFLSTISKLYITNRQPVSLFLAWSVLRNDCLEIPLVLARENCLFRWHNLVSLSPFRLIDPEIYRL